MRSEREQPTFAMVCYHTSPLSLSKIRASTSEPFTRKPLEIGKGVQHNSDTPSHGATNGLQLKRSVAQISTDYGADWLTLCESRSHWSSVGRISGWRSWWVQRKTSRRSFEVVKINSLFARVDSPALEPLRSYRIWHVFVCATCFYPLQVQYMELTKHFATR